MLLVVFAAFCLLPAACCYYTWPDRIQVMGIVNATPDSFSDGGLSYAADAAVRRAHQLTGAGADILDLGGESSRPGAEPVAPDEELRRVLPVAEALAGSIAVPLSIDTTKAGVARRCLAAGAAIINDISALTADPGMARVVADAGAGVVLMHMRGTPLTMSGLTAYEDVVAEVYGDLARRIEWAEAQGIPRARIAIDPGIGFAKKDAQSLALLRNLERFASLGCAVLVGTSRKGLLGQLTGRAPGDRAVASAVSALAAAVAGARVVRVHDVAATVDALRVWNAQRGLPRSSGRIPQA